MKGSDIIISWTSADTNATAFGSVYTRLLHGLMTKYLSAEFVFFVEWPPSYVTLRTDIKIAVGSAKVDIPCDSPSSYGSHITAINGTNVDGQNSLDRLCAPTLTA